MRHNWALFGSVGDRFNEEIAAISTGVCSLDTDYVMIFEVEQYLRGRKRSEIGNILKQACIEAGLSKKQVKIATSPCDRVTARDGTDAC